MTYQKINNNDILDLYNQKRKNIDEIARFVNCSKTTIWIHLKKAGIDIEQRFCLDCRIKYKVSHKFNKGKRCPECQSKRNKEIIKEYLEKNYKRLARLRKKWRERNPNRKKNWLNLHKDPKHLEIRNKIETYIKNNISENEISQKLNITIGENSRDRFTIKWYKKCIKSRESGKRVHELYPFIKKNLPLSGSVLDRKKGALNLIKKLKNEGRYEQHQSKAGKLGGINGGPASIKKQRENKPYYFMNVAFDSEQEKIFCKLLIEHDIIKRPIEGHNVHFKIGRKDIDFFIKQKLFVEYHPFDYSRSEEEYFIERRDILDKNGFEKYPLIVIKNLNEFNKKLLPLFKNDIYSNNNI